MVFIDTPIANIVDVKRAPPKMFFPQEASYEAGM